MEITTERTLGHLFGLVGGLLILVGGLVALVFGVADLALGHALAFAGAASEAFVLFVVGALVLLFAYLGEHGWRDRAFAAGVMLVILAIVGWAALGLGSNVVALIGGILALLAGVLYLIEPTRRAVADLASSA
jgi:drug/metabolite transporter (DMT)-like permease